jgi:hypothetical protein
MKYNPLREEKNEIRLLTLVEGRNSAFVWCKLDHHSLSKHPPYTALSYHWGNPAITKTVMINEQKAQVTVNLEAALRQLEADGYSKIWVDAICINQDDSEERSRQILRMRKIYTQASEVVAWLGIGDENSKVAMKFIKTVTKGETGFQNPLGKSASGSNSVEEETKFWGFMDQASKVVMEVKNLLPEKSTGILNTFHDRSGEDCGDSARKENLSPGKAEGIRRRRPRQYPIYLG